MSITLDLPDEVTADLLRCAERAGQTPEAFAADILRRELFLDGRIKRQAAKDVEWALALMNRLADKDGDRSADGSLWPETPAEIEAWCAEIEGLPRLFDDEAEARAFEEQLAAVRRERSAGLEAHRDRVAGLFAA